MTALDDHGTLPAHAAQMLARLDGLESQMVHIRAMNGQHVEHAERARQLAGQLRSVLLLSDARQYPSAFVVVRAALEHHLIDRLIFLATRHIETRTGVGKDDVAAEFATLVELQKVRPDLESWSWDDQGLHLVWRGYHSRRSKKGRGMIVSPYYFLIDQFDPFTGGKKYAARLASPFWKRSHREEWAVQQAAVWKKWFIHPKVLRALDVNHLLPGRLAMQVEVHYNFLSGFAHPSKRGYEAIYGGNRPSRVGGFDHYASEMALLYVITIAAAELEIFGRMARRAPRLGLREWEDVTTEIRDARLDSSYFWFLGGEPQTLDRMDTVHTPAGERPKWGRPSRDWTKLRDWEVDYWPDPQERIVRLHHGWSEMSSGLVYVSPFQRNDGRR